MSLYQLHYFQTKIIRLRKKNCPLRIQFRRNKGNFCDPIMLTYIYSFIVHLFCSDSLLNSGQVLFWLWPKKGNKKRFIKTLFCEWTDTSTFFKTKKKSMTPTVVTFFIWSYMSKNYLYLKTMCRHRKKGI